MKDCQEKACESPAVARGLCRPHYNKIYWTQIAPPETILNRNEKARQYHYIKDNPDYVPKALRPNKTPEEIAARKARYSKKRRGDRREILNKIKLESGCVDCGYDQHPQALDFDHIDGKTFGISVALGRGRPFEDILTEIERCEVRCANCHRIKTFEERQEL